MSESYNDTTEIFIKGATCFVSALFFGESIIGFQDNWQTNR